MCKVSIAFVDDHPAVVDGICSIFSSDAAFQIVAKGRSAQEAVEICTRMRPDVLVTDLRMPGDALEAIQSISQDMPDTKIVAFTSAEAIETAVDTLEAGASAYVLKGSTVEELRAAILGVVRGETFITQSLAVKVISALRCAASKTASKSMHFSAREEQVIKHLLRGQTNKEIASSLNLSEQTVKHYISVLIQKFQVRNRLEVVIAAQRSLASGGASAQRTLN